MSSSMWPADSFGYAEAGLLHLRDCRAVCGSTVTLSCVNRPQVVVWFWAQAMLQARGHRPCSKQCTQGNLRAHAPAHAHWPSACKQDGGDAGIRRPSPQRHRAPDFLPAAPPSPPACQRAHPFRLHSDIIAFAAAPPPPPPSLPPPHPPPAASVPRRGLSGSLLRLPPPCRLCLPCIRGGGGGGGGGKGGGEGCDLGVTRHPSPPLTRQRPPHHPQVTPEEGGLNEGGGGGSRCGAGGGANQTLAAGAAGSRSGAGTAPAPLASFILSTSCVLKYALSRGRCGQWLLRGGGE
jgi:hypothetical protein